jgi:8-hydroxy-5-deazaflavin:NADPH oxidoreductase
MIWLPHWLRRLPRAAAVVVMAMACAVLLTPGVAAQETGEPLRIGIIGSGNMGGPLGRLWAEAGHQVLYSSRHPEELMELVREAAPRASAGYPDAAAYFGDVIVLAIPPGAVPQLGEDLGDLLHGKIVIDLTNPREDRDGPLTAEWLAMGTGLAMAQYLPGARVVKAFNALSFPMLREAHRPGEQLAIPIAGDDEEAVEIVTALVRDAGFDPVVVGPLESARRFDRGSPVWVTGMTASEVREALGL